MLRQQQHLYQPQQLDRVEEALHTFWRNRGVKLPADRQAVVQENLQEWQALQQSRRADCPISVDDLLELLKARVRLIRLVFPGIRLSKVVPSRPAILHADLALAAQQLCLLRKSMPTTNLSKLVEKCPALITDHGDDLAAAAEAAIARLQAQLPCANVYSMIERHPSLLFQDVEAGLARLRSKMPNRSVDKMVEANPALVLRYA